MPHIFQVQGLILVKIESGKVGGYLSVVFSAESLQLSVYYFPPFQLLIGDITSCVEAMLNPSHNCMSSFSL